MNIRDFINLVGTQNKEIGWHSDPITGLPIELSDGRWAQLIK